MNPSKHFYLVYNPEYGRNPLTGDNQVLEFYNRLKNQYLSAKERPFLYWGKVKKTINNPQLDIREFQDIITTNNENNKDTYLFISDFQHFWVARVTEVTDVQPKDEETLEYYRNQTVEAWFKIEEIDLLENESESTLIRISALSSKHHDSLNPYLGGLRYPVIVNDNLESEEYFSYRPTIMDQVVPTRMLLPNPMIDCKSSRMKELITSYAIKESTFNKLPTIVRNEIITAEEIYHANPKGNIHKVALIYLQALEALLNLTLISSIYSLEENKEKIFRHLKGKDLHGGYDKAGNIKKIIQNKSTHEHNVSINDFKRIIEGNFYEEVISVRSHCMNVGNLHSLNFATKNFFLF